MNYKQTVERRRSGPSLSLWRQFWGKK